MTDAANKEKRIFTLRTN